MTRASLPPVSAGPILSAPVTMVRNLSTEKTFPSLPTLLPPYRIGPGESRATSNPTSTRTGDNSMSKVRETIISKSRFITVYHYHPGGMAPDKPWLANPRAATWKMPTALPNEDVPGTVFGGKSLFPLSYTLSFVRLVCGPPWPPDSGVYAANALAGTIFRMNASWNASGDMNPGAPCLRRWL